jgi:hypothetical protein
MMEEATQLGQGLQMNETMEDLLGRPDVSVTLVAALWMRERYEMATGNRRWN